MLINSHLPTCLTIASFPANNCLVRKKTILSGGCGKNILTFFTYQHHAGIPQNRPCILIFGPAHPFSKAYDWRCRGEYTTFAIRPLMLCRLGSVAERQLYDLVALGFAEDDADRRILIGQLHVLVKSREVEVELAGVSPNSHHSTLHIIILPPSSPGRSL